MKKMKKGFTIVELVIVIAVIAILAAVLIPTFSSVTDRAKESAALQEAKNAYTIAYAEALADDGYINTDDEAEEDKASEGIQLREGNYTFTFDANGTLTKVVVADGAFTFTVSEGALTGAKKAN